MTVPPPASSKIQGQTALTLRRKSLSSSMISRGTKPAHTEQQAREADYAKLMERFHLRKFSSEGMLFRRANHIVIDTVMKKKSSRFRRFSMHRTLRTTTRRKTWRKKWKALTSPITPRSWASTIHGILLLCIYHFQAIYFPFSPSYYPRGSHGTAIVDITLEMFFILDLALNFNTAYTDQGILVTSRRLIARNYLRHWFALDFLSAIPVHSIYYLAIGATEPTHGAIMLEDKALMALRLSRLTFVEHTILLTRVMRIAKRLTTWFRYSRYSHLVGIAQLLWLVLLIAHYMACFWHIITNNNSAESKSVSEQYVADFYFAMTVMQGERNFGGTWEEDLFSTGAVLIGSVILAIVFGNVAMLVANFNANTTAYTRKMEAVYATMTKLDLPPPLRERIHQYYAHIWAEYEVLDGDVVRFQRELTQTLGLEVGLFKYTKLMTDSHLWKDGSPGFATQIMLHLSVRVYLPEDYLVRLGEVGDEMFMINRGVCEVWDPVRRRKSLQKASTDAATNDDNGNGNEADKPMDKSEDEAELNADADIDDEESDSSEDEGGDSRNETMGPRRSSGSKFTLRGMEKLGRGERAYRVSPTDRCFPTGAVGTKTKAPRVYLFPGHAFGEMSLVMNYKRTANICAVTYVEVCALDRYGFQKIISRYPDDRREVLTKMLEDCIEKNNIPLPWGQIGDAVVTKRALTGQKSILLEPVTPFEAAQALVERIDIDQPDETIKYGIQPWGNTEQYRPVFIRRPSSRSTRETLRRRDSTKQLGQTLFKSHSMNSECSAVTCDSSEGEQSASARQGGENVEQTLSSMLKLMHSMADNISQLQQKVSRMENRDRDGSHHSCCRRCSSDPASCTPPAEADANSLAAPDSKCTSTPAESSTVSNPTLEQEAKPARKDYPELEQHTPSTWLQQPPEEIFPPQVGMVRRKSRSALLRQRSMGTMERILDEGAPDTRVPISPTQVTHSETHHTTPRFAQVPAILEEVRPLTGGPSDNGDTTGDKLECTTSATKSALANMESRFADRGPSTAESGSATFNSPYGMAQHQLQQDGEQVLNIARKQLPVVEAAAGHQSQHSPPLVFRSPSAPNIFGRSSSWDEVGRSVRTGMRNEPPR